jgi:hypothetical protein
VKASFSNSFRFNEIEGDGAPGEIRTPDPLLRSYAVQNSKCRCWCRLRGSASFISPLNWTEVGLIRSRSQFNQILPEVAPIERNQEVVMKPDESLSPSLFTFCSQFIAFCRDYRDIFVTDRLLRLTKRLDGKSYCRARRRAAFKISATVPITRRTQRTTAMIEPRTKARIRMPTASAANKIPPRISFRRLSGPGAGEEVPGCSEPEVRERTIWNRWVTRRDSL